MHAGVAFYGLGRERLRAAADGAIAGIALVAGEVAVHIDAARPDHGGIGGNYDQAGHR